FLRRPPPRTPLFTYTTLFRSGEPLELTGAEYRLLSLFLQNPGQVLTRTWILDQLWDGNGNFVDDNTLSVYIRRLREKIEQNPSQDRKSTRLNSSHVSISYAVF